MGRKGILRGGRVRALAAVAALLALVLAWPASGQVVCTGGGCGGGALTSPVTTDPVSATGVWTFDNAANTPLVCSDGLSAPAAAAGVDGADLYLYATDGNPSTSDQNGGSIVLRAGSGISDQAGDADGGGIQLNPGAGTGAGVAGEVTVAANRNFCVGDGSGSASGICIGSSAITGEGSSADANETILAFGDASADNTLTLKGTASGVEATVTTGALLTGAGTGTGRVSVGGVLCKGAPAQATTGTSEEILATCTIPAATLTTNGQFLRVSLMATTAANTNNKRLRVRLGGIGGTVVFDTGAVAANNQVYNMASPLLIWRYSATVAHSQGYMIRHGEPSSGAPSIVVGYGASISTALAVTWANANDLVITGETGTAAGDLNLRVYSVEVVQ